MRTKMSDDAAPRIIVIVGAGQAGGEVATALRQQKFAGRILLIGDEPQPPYKRPPLSKAFLAGAMTREQLYVVPSATLERVGIEFIGGVQVTQIDRSGRMVHLADGRSFGYDKLVIATGGRARRINVPGSEKPNIFTLRTIADVVNIRRRFLPGNRLVVIGGGFIGLEIAAVAIKLGLDVAVLESQPRVLARVTAPEVSTFFEDLHRRHSVNIRVNATARAFIGDPEATHVVLDDGTTIAADLIVVGVGLIPNVELAEDSGLRVDNGIFVDEFARTSDPDILAVGDCTNHPSEFAGGRLRLESVQNAVEQGRHAASTLMGAPKPYQTVPWFWSDQYDIKFQMVGLIDGYEALVLRGDANDCSFSAFFLRSGRVVAVHSINRPQDFLIGKKLVAAHARVPADQLADETIALMASSRIQVP
jgi:3-phenylpropionate/trans-cinnamate dioxygenase ferredoxin reductase subunit